MNLPKTIRTQSDDSRAQKHAVLPHNPKRHSASFRRVLVLVYGTVVLFALLITGIYTVVSPQIFASNKISDLIPKGQIIAGYIESTLRGELSSTYLVPLIGRSTSQWEATVWVVDASGDTLIRTQQIEGRRVGRLPAKLSGSMLPQVLSGEVATHVGSMEDLSVSRQFRPTQIHTVQRRHGRPERKPRQSARNRLHRRNHERQARRRRRAHHVHGRRHRRSVHGAVHDGNHGRHARRSPTRWRFRCCWSRC